MLESAEEGFVDISKHGFTKKDIPAHVSFMWTSNPVGGRFKPKDKVDSSKFPVIAQWEDRNDYITVWREDKSAGYLRRYSKYRIYIKDHIEEFKKKSLWLKKFLIFARTFTPEIPDAIRAEIVEFLIQLVDKGILGVPRSLDAAERSIIAIAKLQLKNTIDWDDLEEMKATINTNLEAFGQSG